MKLHQKSSERERLASHCCELGLIPVPGVTHGLSLVMFLILALRVSLQQGSPDFLPCDPFSWSLFWFPWHKVTRTFTFPPFNIFPLSISRLSPSISSGFPYNLLIPIYIPGRRDVPRPLALESRWLTIMPARSPHAKYLLILIWVV